MASKQIEDTMDVDEKLSRPSRGGGGSRKTYVDEDVASSAGEETVEEAPPKSKKGKGKAASKGKGKQKKRGGDDSDFEAGQGGGESENEGKVVKKAAGGSNKKGTGNKRGKQGRLAAMVTAFPIDLIHCILSYADPPTLVKLSSTAKIFRRLLTSEDSVTIWRRSLVEAGLALPFESTRWSLSQWTRLIFVKRCQLCDRVVHKAAYTAGKRLCKGCTKVTCRTSNRLRTELAKGTITRASIAEMTNPIRWTTKKGVISTSAAAAAATTAADEEEDEDEEEDDEDGKENDEDGDKVTDGDDENFAAPGTTAAVVDKIKIFVAAYSIAPRITNGRRETFYIPDFVRCSDKLFALEAEDVAEFGDVAKVSHLQLLQGKSTDKVKVTGTRVRAFFNAEVKQNAAVIEDAAKILQWERNGAKDRRVAKNEASTARYDGIVKNLSALGYTANEIQTASYRNYKLFHSGAVLSENNWKRKKDEMVKIVDAVRQQNREYELQRARKDHQRAVTACVVNILVEQAPFAISELIAATPANTLGERLFAQVFSLSSYTLETYVKTVFPAAIPVMEDAKHPLWSGDRTQLKAVLAPSMEEWWSEMTALVGHVEAVYSATESETHGLALLPQAVWGCRECRSLFSISGLFSHGHEGKHTLFIDSKHAECITKAKDALEVAFAPNNTLVFSRKETTVQELASRGEVWSCQDCSTGIDKQQFLDARSTQLYQERLNGTGYQHSAGAETSGSMMALGDGGQLNKEAISSDGEGGATQPLTKSIDIVWTKTMHSPWSTSRRVDAPQKAELDGVEVVRAFDIGLWSMIAHFCGHETLSSRPAADKPSMGCPSSDGKVTMKLSYWEERSA